MERFFGWIVLWSASKVSLGVMWASRESTRKTFCKRARSILMSIIIAEESWNHKVECGRKLQNWLRLPHDPNLFCFACINNNEFYRFFASPIRPMIETSWFNHFCVNRDLIGMMKMTTFSVKSSPGPEASTPKPSNESDFSGEPMHTTVFGCVSVNATTKLYRRFYLFKMICFPFIPILALFVQNLFIFLEQINAYEDTLKVNQQVSICMIWFVFFRICIPFLRLSWFSTALTSLTLLLLQISLTVRTTSRYWGVEIHVSPLVSSTGERLKAFECHSTWTLGFSLLLADKRKRVSGPDMHEASHEALKAFYMKCFGMSRLSESLTRLQLRNNTRNSSTMFARSPNISVRKSRHDFPLVNFVCSSFIDAKSSTVEPKPQLVSF